MSKFVARKTAPARSDKHYYSDNIFYKCGYGMPNCTCYAWGRFYELIGSRPKLHTGNAKTWYPKGTAFDGYGRGQTPKLGAVACWSNGGAGHVAIVEEIFADGSINTSNSAWRGNNFYMKRIPRGYAVRGYQFQGFIYPPINFTNETGSEFVTGRVYTLLYNVKVRHGAGIGAAWKNRNELTADGRAHSVNQTKAVLKAGTQVTVKELRYIGNDVWARIPSGWIAIKFNGEKYVR